MNAAAWPENYIVNSGAQLDDMTTGWTPTTCDAALDPAVDRTGNSALHLVPSSTTCNVQKVATFPTPSGGYGQPYHVLVYAKNLNANSSCRLRIFSGPGAAGDNMHYDWNQNNLRPGWNDLTIHSDEDGTTTYSSGNTWTVNAGTRAGIAAAPLTAMRIQFDNCQGASNPEFWIGGIWQGARSRPMITMGFDAYAVAIKDTALPAMEAAGMKGYISLIGAQALIAAAGSNLARLDLLYSTYGWDIINHGTTHTNIVDMTPAELDAEVRVNRDAIRSRWPRAADIFVTPNNAIDAVSADYLESIGTIWCRNGETSRRNTSISVIGIDRPVFVGGEGIDNPITLARSKQHLASAIKYGETLHLYGHGIVSDATVGFITDTNFEAFCLQFSLYRAQGLIDCKTPLEWYRGMTTPQMLA